MQNILSHHSYIMLLMPIMSSHVMHQSALGFLEQSMKGVRLFVQNAAKDTQTKIRSQFFSDFRRQLYNNEDDRSFYVEVQASLKTLGEQLEQGKVAIGQLEQHLLNVACDDPGATVGMGLILPVLQTRLDGLASEHATQEAQRAELELLQQTVQNAVMSSC
jgi:hypothetical protein